jgi:hypothetical protein
LNTSLANLGLHTEAASLPIAWNQPGILPDTVLLHWYSHTHQDSRIKDAVESQYRKLEQETSWQTDNSAS